MPASGFRDQHMSSKFSMLSDEIGMVFVDGEMAICAVRLLNLMNPDLTFAVYGDVILDR